MLNSSMGARTTNTRRLNLKFFAAQSQIPLPNEYFWVGCIGLVEYWKTWTQSTMLIVRPKMSKMPQKNSTQNVCPSPKVQDFWKKAFSGCPYEVCAWEAFFTDLVKSLCFSDKFYTSTTSLIDFQLRTIPLAAILPVYISFLFISGLVKNQEMESHPSWTHTVLQINLHAYFTEIGNKHYTLG